MRVCRAVGWLLLLCLAMPRADGADRAGVSVLPECPPRAGKAPSGAVVWSLEDCLRYGLAHHPAIRQAAGVVESARARLGGSRAALGTKLTATGAFTRRRTEYSRALAHARVPGGTDDLIDSTANSLSVRKVFTDFGRTAARTQTLRSDLQAAIAEKRWAKVHLAAEIKIAWLRALRAKALRTVQQENLDRFQIHLERVRGFVEVGSRPPYDITKAEVDVADARVTLIGAESAVRNALSTLRRTVGAPNEITIDPAEAVSVDVGEAAHPSPHNLHQPGDRDGSCPAVPDLDIDRLLDEARAARPDLRSERLALDTARLRKREARLGRQPTLTGSADYTWSGTVTPLDRSYTIGLVLTAPILDGRSTEFAIREARSNLEVSTARLEQRELVLRDEIEQAVTGILDADQRFEAAGILVRQASEALELAEGRYEAGLGTPIELTDARTGYANARARLVAAHFDERIARAVLDRVLGRFPPEVRPWPDGSGGAGLASIL